MSQSQRRPKRPSTTVRVKADSQSSVDEGACTVCHESIELFAVGPCDHPICYKCSTRMRTLCDQFYCAICRADMPKVLFVKTLKKFDSFKLDSFCIFREKGFFFENENIKSAFEKLLENRCQVCKENFNSFKELETHLKRVHERHFCDLCVDNLKLFSCDRKFYERRQLAEHKRLGDVDDKSYRQHPLCKFCDIRYFDNDELLRHLRKDHFFCHFCESDGLTNEYFQEYSFLQNHFREKHFLCEQDGCGNVEFVNAFRSKIDLKAHVSKFHGSNLGRQQARQLRAIEVDINYGPRPNATGRRPHDRQRGGRGGAGGFEDRQGGRNPSRRNENQGHPDDQEKRMETDAALALSLSLADAQRQGSVCLMDPRIANQSRMTQGTEAAEKTEKTDFKAVSDDFPILHGNEKSSANAAATGGKESRTGNSDTMAKILALGVGHSVGNSRLNEAEFPELGGGKSSGVRKASGVWNKGGSLPDSSNRSSVAEKASGKVLKNNVKPDSFSISGTVASFGSEWTAVGSQSKNSSAPRPSSGFHKSRTDPNLSDFPILGKPSNDVGTSWVKNKEVKLPDQPQVKKKQEGLTKLETKKKAERHSDCEEGVVRGTTGINGRGVDEFCGENGSGRKEAVKSLADIASLLTGSQTESKAANDEALSADSSGLDKKSRKKNSDNRVKNDRELSATKKDANQEEGKADNRAKKETLKQNVMFRDKSDNREEKKSKVLRQEDAANRKRPKNKGNEKTSATNLKESQTDKKLSDETKSGDVCFKEKPETEFVVHSLPTTTDIGTSVLLPEPTDSELDKPDGFKTGKAEDEKTECLNDINNLPVIEADYSMAAKESCIDYDDAENEPKFLPSDFPSLVPNSTGAFSPGYNFNALPGSFPYGQIDIMPDVSINPLLVGNDIPCSLDPGLSIVRDTSSDGTGLLLPTPPPGFPIAASKPPPGFAPMVVKPPPGFSQPLITEPDKLTNDSLSNLLNLYPTGSSYKPPKQFRERLAKFAEILSESTGNSFAQFSLLSHEFQSNLITAGDYYRKCSEVMDSEAFRKVFPELVALMPSIERQQELLKVHRMHLSEEPPDIRKGWKPWNCPTDGLIPCSYCGQIVLKDDSLDHMTEHGSQDFPLLK